MINYDNIKSFFTPDTDFASFVPNMIRAVKGEKDFFFKINPFLKNAEHWFSIYFFKPDSPLMDNQDILYLAQSVIFAQAYSNAIPQLDVVLTQNGIATTSNSNLVAASSQRVERLIKGVIEQRDNAIISLLKLLLDNETFTATVQGEWFRQSLFQSPEDIKKIAGESGLWEQFLQFRNEIATKEAFAVERYISPEVYNFLCSYNGSQNTLEARIIKQIKAYFINEEYISSDIPLREVVNAIRNSNSLSHMWNISSTAKGFIGDSFCNQKKSHGYFF